MSYLARLIVLAGLLASIELSYAQSDPFQAVRPSAPPAPAPAARPAAPEASRSAPAPQGLRAAPPSAAARGADGTWQGTITCDPLGRAGRTNTAFSLTVANGAVRYERRAFTPEGTWLGAYERGAGSISPDGGVTLTGQAEGQGSAAGSTARASYRGRIDGNTMNLDGQQLWIKNRTGNSSPRPCRINLSRS